ncbi:metallophosphoesterase family protein [Paenibacillus thiaminolyticus]|uniref:metallophosphoesterase family protein n=1 Tax=Paenibacillus thiaminolyticus TaxID=49283 RepID=UPI00232E8E8A|nr:metallophosphoesterase family protein [Paenibacillus thiaminolyticus]WCF07408.1 metallophosphoesterase family protein [Paenibacillus thiaminolyticus]
MSIPPQFRPDGTFTIVQFTDLHVGGGRTELDARTLALTERIIERERPDLAVYSGDMLYGKETAEPVATLRRIVEAAERREVPFAVIFGNHDAEGGATREELLEGIASCRMSLAEAGPADIHGVGNYVIAVKASSQAGPAALLYLFDSGVMAPASVGGYAWIRPDQVDWYRRESNRLRQRHGALPSLAFFHIPIPEFREAWESGQAAGIRQEAECCPRLNSGLFAAMLESGDMIAAFAGHDHDNDYAGSVHGIRLGYGRVTGYGGYGGLQRGARIIRLLEGRSRFQTWIRLDDGSKVSHESRE